MFHVSGMYVQMLMSGMFLTVVRLHMKKRCEPGSKAYQMVEKVFKPAFEYNVKLELLSQGKELPKPKVGPDGMPVNRIERIKWKAQKKMDATKAKAQKKVAEAKAKAKAKAAEAKVKAVAMAKAQATKVKAKVKGMMKKGEDAAEAKAGEDPEAGAPESKEEAKEEEGTGEDTGAEEAKGEGGDGEGEGAEGEGEKKPPKLKPGDEGYEPQKGWQMMIPGVAFAEFCGKKRKHDSWVPPAPPVPEELEKLSPEDLVAKLPAEGLPELIKVKWPIS
jgi:hypothetical protein